MSWKTFAFAFIIASIFMWLGMPERPHKIHELEEDLDGKD